MINQLIQCGVQENGRLARVLTRLRPQDTESNYFDFSPVCHVKWHTTVPYADRCEHNDQ